MLRSNNLQSAAIVILQALCNLSSLRVVDLRNNQLTEETGEYLSHLILNNPELNDMNLIDNKIGKGVLHIAKALKKVTSLQLLGLGYNSFPAQVCDELALAIQSNQCLQSLWLPCICLNSNVLQSMVTISTLTDLNLNSTQLLEETGEVLSCIILHNTGLEHLYLSNNNLGNGAVHVMKAIQHLTQLRTLHLSNVTSSGVVSEECGEALSYAMSNNNHLENIDLSNNNLQEVAVHVVKGLQQLKSLQVLYLSHTNIPKESSDDLALAIECNQCLNTIMLHSNNLQSAAIVILQALCNLSSLRVVDLRNNQLTEETGEYLSNLILNNLELNHMNLIDNNIGKGVLHIA